MRACPSASVWLLRYLGDPPGSALLRTIFLDCPVAELRLFFSKLLCLTLQTHFDHGGSEEDPVDKVLNELLSLLDRDVVECYKNAAQYFDFMREYGGNVSGVHRPPQAHRDTCWRFVRGGGTGDFACVGWCLDLPVVHWGTPSHQKGRFNEIHYLPTGPAQHQAGRPSVARQQQGCSPHLFVQSSRRHVHTFTTPYSSHLFCCLATMGTTAGS